VKACGGIFFVNSALQAFQGSNFPFYVFRATLKIQIGQMVGFNKNYSK